MGWGEGWGAGVGEYPAPCSNPTAPQSSGSVALLHRKPTTLALEAASKEQVLNSGIIVVAQDENEMEIG